MRGTVILVQRPAAATGGRDREANEILVTTCETQVHAAIPAFAEQLVATRATPFCI